MKPYFLLSKKNSPKKIIALTLYEKRRKKSFKWIIIFLGVRTSAFSFGIFRGGDGGFLFFGGTIVLTFIGWRWNWLE
jgi:hypothetical protein